MLGDKAEGRQQLATSDKNQERFFESGNLAFIFYELDSLCTEMVDTDKGMKKLQVILCWLQKSVFENDFSK